MASTRVSQEAFDEAVREGIDALGMDQEEALQDAIKAFQLRGADLSRVRKTVPPSEGRAELRAKGLARELKSGVESGVLAGMKDGIRRLRSELAGSDAEEGAAEGAGEEGVVESVVAACERLGGEGDAEGLEEATDALAKLFGERANQNLFWEADGPMRLVNGVLMPLMMDESACAACLRALHAAAKGHEENKRALMRVEFHAALRDVVQLHGASKFPLESACAAARGLVTADDNDYAASATFQHGREMFNLHPPLQHAFLDALRAATDEDCALSAAAALKSIAVNDDICLDLARHSGLREAVHTPSRFPESPQVARTALSLVKQLCHSDENKSLAIHEGALETVLTVIREHSESKLVVEQALGVLGNLTLRNPAAASQVVSAGCAPLALSCMRNHPTSPGVQRQGCIFIRNVVSRSPDLRQAFLENEAESLIRSAKRRHKECDDVGAAALRDLGYDDYND